MKVFSLFLISFSLYAAQVFNMGNGAEPRELDPLMLTGVPESRIAINLFDGLVALNPSTRKLEPAIADKWKISKDGKVYTFTLREAKWSNGEVITAKDFHYSILRLLDPKTASEYAYYGKYIKQGDAFTKGKATADQVGVKVINDKTLEITLEEATPFFLAILAHTSFLPIHKATVEKFGAKWTRPENIVVNGAFKPTKWELNKVIEAKKNPLYWDAASVKLDQVNFIPTENTNSEEKMFRSGQLHSTYELPVEMIPVWKKKDTPELRTDDQNGSYFFLFNVKKAPFNDVRVRKALAYAIDRKKITELVTKTFETPLTTLVPPNCGGFKPTSKIATNDAQFKEARDLLAKAGYPKGANFPKTELLYNTNERHKKITEALQQMWKENLGINIQLYNQEWKVFLNTQASHNFQITRKGWVADFNDPVTFLELFVTGSGNNQGEYSNKKFDETVQLFSHEMDHKKRAKLLQTAEDILFEDMPFLPLYVYRKNYLVSNKVQQGWYSNSEERYFLKYVKLEQ